MLQYIKFGHNPSFGSKDGVQIFWSKSDIQSAGVTLKTRSMSPKSNHFFLHPNNGQNPPIGSEDRVQKRSYAAADIDGTHIKSNMSPSPHDLLFHGAVILLYLLKKF